MNLSRAKKTAKKLTLQSTEVGCELTKEIGCRLHDAREKRHLTLIDMSHLMGGILSPSRISNYEQGLRRMGLEEAMIISHILKVSPQYLLGIDMSKDIVTKLLEVERALSISSPPSLAGAEMDISGVKP